MTWLEALILGILQGLTEFIPVSSSGHLELGGVLFGLQDPDAFFTFNVMVHGATFLSVVVVFYKDIWQLLSSVFSFRWNADTKFALFILASAVPVGIIGLMFEEQIESFFEGRVMLIGFMLLITALLLYLTRIAPPGTKDISLKKALIIGLAQTLAVMPGISRSGATISTALYLGVEKAKAIKFSFLMVLIPIFGANFLKVLRMSEEAQTGGIETTPLIVGTIAAFVAGLAACKWMIAIVRKGNISYFSFYCLIIGLLAIGYGIFGPS